MKQTFLDHISNEKISVVEPLINKVIGFYRENLELVRTDDVQSTFAREIKDQEGKIVPLGKIQLTTKGNIEEGLVHELLHLALPLKTGLYTMEKTRQDPQNFFAVYNNMAEHDLILPDFLEMGYHLETFLAGGFTIDYKRESKEAMGWWIYEYIRNVITKNHLGSVGAKQSEKAIKDIRQYGVQFYPRLDNSFKTVYEWIKSRKKMEPKDHPQMMRALIVLLNLGTPGKYLAPDGDGALKEVSF
ncbi:hypothetical protein HF324_29265 [Chitinophaga oryzae]|uniref:Peptidase MA-like domain-containing protein n=1 Tax=Chitinophaga oryzae TaxID=2725414 RepID=A0ABX6LNP6_9BACT|nr:hypothetical protein [Chitinophaga oryzae]QJB41716.1 hypothetical protein HF324_29265 [Chitinophaga oryzae]